MRNSSATHMADLFTCALMLLRRLPRTMSYGVQHFRKCQIRYTTSEINLLNSDNIRLMFSWNLVNKYAYAGQKQKVSHLYQRSRSKRRRPLCRFNNRFAEKRLRYWICRCWRPKNGWGRLWTAANHYRQSRNDVPGFEPCRPFLQADKACDSFLEKQ